MARKKMDKNLEVDKKRMLADLKSNYNFLIRQIDIARATIEDEGQISDSPANGRVRNPATVTYDTFTKQLLAVNKQISDLERELGTEEHDDDFD